MLVADIERILRLAREHGVSELTTADLSFKFGPAPSAAKPPTTKELGAPPCVCGHAVHDHTPEGCLHCGPDARCLRKRGK